MLVLLVLVAIAAATSTGDEEQRTAGDRGGSSGSTQADPSDASTSATPATTTTEALRQATDAEPLRILVAGDSLVAYIGRSLTAAYTDRPVEIIDAWKGSSGLARPDFYDWPATLRDLVATHDPDVVVVGFGGNDAQALQGDGAAIDLSDPAWAEEYRNRVDEVLTAVEAPGRTLWWLGLPVTSSGHIEKYRPTVTEAVRTAVGTRPWATFVDTAPILSPDGVYADAITGPDGTKITVRGGDGIHLSPEGGRMIIDTFTDQIDEDHGL